MMTPGLSHQLQPPESSGAWATKKLNIEGQPSNIPFIRVSLRDAPWLSSLLWALAALLPMGPTHAQCASALAVGCSAPQEQTLPSGNDRRFRELISVWNDPVIGAPRLPAMEPVATLRLSSGFGVRADPFRRTAAMHTGIDIPGPPGTPILASADGLVERAGNAGGYGNMIEIDHGEGIETRYAHLRRILVRPNTKVRRGDIIALMGSSGRSTGSHLHYEVRLDGHPIDPLRYLNGQALVNLYPGTITPYLSEFARARTEAHSQP
jgi:hypothetical protein